MPRLNNMAWTRPYRKQFEEYEKIDADSSWYEVLIIDRGMYAICEPRHFQEVISFLIIGEKSALLWDTGMGFYPILPVIRKITDLPVIAVNSHSHFDHVGGNSEFDFVYGLLNDVSKKRAESIWKPEKDDENFTTEAVCLKDFSFEGFYQKEYKLIPVEEGQEFDLGKSKWKAAYTPGHSTDSMVLYNEEMKILLTGDTIYPGVIYAQENPVIYADTCKKLAEKWGEYTLLCSHNEPVRPGHFMTEVSEAFDALINKKTEGQPAENGMWLHKWKEISILTSIPG